MNSFVLMIYRFVRCICLILKILTIFQFWFNFDQFEFDRKLVKSELEYGQNLMKISSELEYDQSVDCVAGFCVL